MQQQEQIVMVEDVKTSDKYSNNDIKECGSNNNDDEIQEFMNELRPLYPPILTPESLIPKFSNSSRKLSGKFNNKRKKEPSVKFPNAFIAYRMEFCKQLKNKRICLTMQDVSYFASKLWKKEPCSVKKTYTQLANDAKLLYEKLNVNELDLVTSTLSSLNSSPVQVNSNLKDDQQIFSTKDQQNLIEADSSTNVEQTLYIEQNLSPVVHPYNILFNGLPLPSEEYIAPPPVLPQSYIPPDLFQYEHYSIPDLKHRIHCLETEREILNNVVNYLQYNTKYSIQYSGQYW
ncbi:15492_t:CDS:2 [Funneliformis caledonium]|uniref:15492_t:CDS:1 n=2 Tax=Funneliformis TaxID=1117308 RepID=A0A9N9HNS7_9GLOM|nr:9829_t:CDS:2 [Funneliformis mosseae]CAG8698309.1 15492_t:CDS:2 [Funneliformis caledonium]